MMRSMRFPARSVSALAAIALVVSSCSSDTNSENSSTNPNALTIAAAFYPISEIVSRVTNDVDVNIVNLTPPGVGAHDHQLTAQQLDALSDADAVFYLGGGLQPSVEKAVEQLPSSIVVVDLLDSATTIEIAKDADEHSSDSEHADEHDHAHEVEDDDHNHGDTDPHAWLDPANMARMTDSVVAALSTLSVDNADTFSQNGETYRDELTQLGTDMDQAFTTCESRALVTSHDAFGYFAARTNLDTVPIAGVSPDNEPSAKELEDIAAAAQNAGATTVFFENLLPDELAKTVASVIGADVDSIDPIETLSESALEDGETYISIQRENIRKIAQGLRCQ
ncbi:MAG: hypothetical protein RIR69_478 [Actinomycetota bacterium]|jgi:zinc transport system substrate-binding protein